MNISKKMKNKASSKMNQRKKQSKGLFLLEYIKEFADETSLHGFKHLRAKNTTCLEKLFWACAIIVLFVGTIILNWSSVHRFQANPTVINIETGYIDWIVPYFAITMCYADKRNSTLTKEFIDKNWGDVKNSTEKYDYYNRFIDLVVNINYKTFHHFQEYQNDEELAKIDMLDLAKKVFRSVEYKSKPFAKHQDIITERGICHAFNSHNSRYFAPSKIKSKKSPSFICKLGAQCNAHLWDMPEDVEVNEKDHPIYTHPADEVANVQVTPIFVEFRSLIELEYFYEQLVASNAVRHLTIRQRRCVYPEDGPDLGLPVATYNVCQMKCRRELAIRLCGCYPYFYQPFTKGFQRTRNVCDAKGLFCLSHHANYLIRLVSENGTEATCPCLPNCETTTYILMKLSIEKAEPPIEIIRQVQWDIPRMNTKRYHRKIIFTFDDLLVSIGGITGLFLGSSIISIIEIFYYFTLRLGCILIKKWLRKRQR